MTAPNAIVAVLDSPNSESKTASIFNIPLNFHLRMNAGFDSYGTTPYASAGSLTPIAITAWDTTMNTIPQIGVVCASLTPTKALVLTNKFLIPDHGPLALKGFFASVALGLCSYSGGYVPNVDEIDVLISQVDSTGTETVLNATTLSGLAVVGPGTASYVSFRIPVSANFASVVTIAAGYRAAITLKVWAHNTGNTGYSGIALNADGGAYTSPTISGNNDTYIALRV